MAKKSFFVQGVGSGVMAGADGTAMPLFEMQDMGIEISTSMENVFGGDGMFPLYNFVKEKSAQFTFTNATFDMDMLKYAQGATMGSAGDIVGFDSITITAGAGTLSITTGVDVNSVIVVGDDGTKYSKVGATPATGQFTVTNLGVMTFATADNGKVVKVSYIASATGSGIESADILTTSVPGFVEIRHRSLPIEQPDGSKVEIHTRIFKARCDGKINIDFKRGTAFAPKLTFQSLDPQRSDKKFVSMVRRNVS